MAGGKKFNVWIVYADLFSNLSTFLFISAFGMFAALGSGALNLPTGPSPVQPPGTTSCPPDEPGPDAALTEPVSGYTAKFMRLDGRALGRPKCAYDFAIRDYRFVTGKTDVSFFVPDGNRQLTFRDNTFNKTICGPLWGAVLEANQTWRMTLIGLASARSNAACRTKRDPGPKAAAALPVYTSGDNSFMMSVDDIAACRARGDNSSGRCRFAMSCYNSKVSAYNEDWCQDIRDTAVDIDNECLVNVGRLRAQSVAQLCQEVLGRAHFDVRIVQKANEDYVPVNLKAKWLDRITPDGAALDSADGSRALQDGMIVVELRPRDK